MSLPKRDGVHDRYYLIHKPDTSPEVLAEADLCIQDVLTEPLVKITPPTRPWCEITTGHPFFPTSSWSGICPNCL